MAIQNQLSALPVQGGDVTFKNFGATDIPAGLVVLADQTQPTTTDPMGVLLPTASPSTLGTPLGISMETIRAGGRGRVRVMGAQVCTADGPLLYGQFVEVSNTAARLGWVRLATGASPVVGMCISPTAATGDPCLVLVLPGAAGFRQAGTATLVAGTVTVSNATLTANSVVVVSCGTPAGTASTTGYIARIANRNVGAGTFTLEAIVAAGTINVADTSVVNYVVLN